MRGPLFLLFPLFWWSMSCHLVKTWATKIGTLSAFSLGEVPKPWEGPYFPKVKCQNHERVPISPTSPILVANVYSSCQDMDHQNRGNRDPLMVLALQANRGNFKLTKYCACHTKWIWFSWLIRVTYETSFTMRGATRVTLQTHQVLRTVPTTQFWVQDWGEKSLNCFRQYTDESKISEDNPRIPEDNPTIKSSSRTGRFGDLTRPILETHFVWKNTTFRAPAIAQNDTKCCACHENWLTWSAWHRDRHFYSLLASILS